MRKILVGLAAVAVAAILAGCGPTVPVNPVVTPTFHTSEVTYIEGNTVPDVDPPTKLNVIMVPTGDPVQRCLDWGGYYSYENDLHYCEDVDY